MELTSHPQLQQETAAEASTGRPATFLTFPEFSEWYSLIPTHLDRSSLL
jgi:hypothetical protein